MDNMRCTTEEVAGYISGYPKKIEYKMKFFYKIALASLLVLPMLSCTSTTKVASQFNTPETSVERPASLSSLARSTQRTSLDGLAFHVVNDETHLYVLVDFVSSRLYQNAREFGFSLYIDAPGAVKRSFGVTYPSGIYHHLGNYPGAQKGFLEEPNWTQFPENRAFQEMAERNSRQNALLVQRRNRRDPMQPFSLPLGQLSAQSLHIHLEDDERTGRISFAIPLETGPTSQFTPDIKPGEKIDLGFEIDPIRLHDLSQRGGAPLITSETASGTAQSDADQEQRERLNRILRRIGDPYEEWVQVELATAKADS